MTHIRLESMIKSAQLHDDRAPSAQLRPPRPVATTPRTTPRITGTNCRPDEPAHGATKAALHALGQSLAVALAPHGIAVTSVAPGFVATERQTGKLSGPEGERLRAESPFGRVGTPEEVAATVHFLASPAAAWASETIVDLNGASHLRI
ncbi:NAD(P)-dependent dehydrogenase (short-subunit alcohol dehydrogenase family) [Streptomyces sp. MJP52]|nr:NAD(P)-dependent dehydrogenase (short-subunit alcohol dehydrogenase family) [Streptomyces sp. MJP52]